VELASLDDTFLYISRRAECEHDKQDAVSSDRKGQSWLRYTQWSQFFYQ